MTNMFLSVFWPQTRGCLRPISSRSTCCSPYQHLVTMQLGLSVFSALAARIKELTRELVWQAELVFFGIWAQASLCLGASYITYDYRKPRVSTVIFKAEGLAAAEMILLSPFMNRIAMTDLAVLNKLCRLGAESKRAA